MLFSPLKCDIYYGNTVDERWEHSRYIKNVLDWIKNRKHFGKPGLIM